MGTFKKKPEVVDARQFTGGVQNGSDLAFWINEHGQSTETRAEWQEAIVAGGRVHPERVRLRSYCYRGDIYVGDWVVLRQNGTLDHERPQDFEAEYEVV